MLTVEKNKFKEIIRITKLNRTTDSISYNPNRRVNDPYKLE